MNYSSKLVLASLLLVNAQSFAATPAEGWYVGGMFGLNYSPNIKLYSPFPVGLPVTAGLPRTGSISHGLGANGAFDVGYRFCNFRFEGELNLNYSPFSRAKFGGYIIKRHLTPTSPFRLSANTVFGAGFLNTYYDFYDEDDDPTWGPYLGLGIGYSYIQNHVNFDVPLLFAEPVSYVSKVNKKMPIGQLILGINYFASDNTAIGLDYRYITTQTIAALGNRVQTNTFNLIFNYWFDDN